MVTDDPRFWAHVIKGDDPTDCWVWTGAISDDGYGRYWTTTDGRQRVLRPHRYAYQLITGREPDGHVLHRCDFPLCVHADVDEEISHLRTGTNAQNVTDRAARKRSGNQHTSTTIAGAPRRARYQLMTEIRDWVRTHGYDRSRINALIAGYNPDDPTLF